MRQDNKQIYGFTLIELLFVIALIGVLASFGVSMMQKRAENFKIEKTALQMQHMLQAGMAWNVDHKGDWPQCGDTKNHSQDQGFYVNYIGENVTNDPWGLHSYQWCNTSQFNPPMGNRFFIDAEARDNQAAKRIAALLPSADICTEADPYKYASCSPNNDQGRYVKAYVNVPGQAINGGIMISRYGTISVSLQNKPNADVSSGDIILHCPEGTIGDLVFGLERYHHYGHVQINHIKQGDEADVYVTDKNCAPRNSEGTITCKFTLHANDNKKSPGNTTIDATMSYLGLCVSRN